MQQYGIAVRLRSIQYTGQNIGSDTEFDISVNDSKIHIGLDIEHGLTRQFDQPLLMQVTDGSEVKLAISATVIEERELAPDKGANSQTYTVDSLDRKSLPPLTVSVSENLGLLGTGKAKADFIFTFEADHFVFGRLGVRYVSITDKGWLLCRGEKGAKDFSLPRMTKVRVTKIEQGREYFTVLEGPLRGQMGSAKLQNGISSLSSSRVRRDPPIELTYHNRTHQLEIPGLSSFKVATPPRNPYPVGEVFRIEIPDFPHAGGRTYEKLATFATTWFRIDDPKVPDRYVHTGRVSAGCSTVTDRKKWDEVYLFLINRRLDDRYVATVRVADS